MNRVFPFVVGIEAFFFVLRSSEYGLILLYARLETVRPFCYRVLVPFISQLISLANINLRDAIVFVVILFSVGFFFATVYLYRSAGVKHPELSSFLTCQIMFLLTFHQLKPYDYSTAFFFALMLGLLANKKHAVFLAVFPLATLNRETTFLIIVFYAVYFWGKMPVQKYFANLIIMVSLFAGIKLITQLAFDSNGGHPVWYTLDENISYYSKHLWVLILIVASSLFIVFSSFFSSEFIKKAVLSIFVIQFALFFLAGMPLEARVFAESVPLFILIKTKPLLFLSMLAYLR